MTMNLGRLGLGFGRMGTFAGGNRNPIRDLFADGTDGYWFADADYSRLAASGEPRLFTLSTGATPATAATDSVGLVLEEHLGAALGAELVTDGGFDADASWTKGTGWTISGGVASFSNPTGTTLAQSANTTPGTYRFANSVKNWITGNVTAAINAPSTTTSPSMGANGNYVHRLTTPVARSAVSINGVGTSNIAVDDVSVRRIEGNHGIQGTSGARPTIQTAGGKLFLRFDALDDNLLTTFLAQNGANSIIAKVTVPASLAAAQVISGSSGSGANRCFLAVDTGGLLCGGVGSDSTTTIKGTTDLRGLTVVVGLSFDGTTVKLFVEEAEEYSAAQNSTPTVTIPHRIGANNNNGTAGSFWGGDIYHCVAVRKARTLAQFLSIRAQMNA